MGGQQQAKGDDDGDLAKYSTEAGNTNNNNIGVVAFAVAKRAAVKLKAFARRHREEQD